MTISRPPPPAFFLFFPLNLNLISKKKLKTSSFSGAKYTRRAADADECEQLARAEPSLSKSRNFEGKWYCSLTCHVINATPSALRKHLEGKKLAFARALAAKGEHKAVPEPDLEEEEEEDDDLEEMEASEGEEEEEDVGGSGRAKAKAEAAAGAASKKEKGGTKKDKKKAASAPPPRTPDESVSKAKADASRPSRPKRARRGAA